MMVNSIQSYLPEIKKAIDCKKRNPRVYLMKENLYNLLSNLLTDDSVRKNIAENTALLESLV
jgi:hypothetical protein